jgi:hypothetical protein
MQAVAFLFVVAKRFFCVERHNYCMDYRTWLQQREIMPKPDRAMQLIQAAWTAGVEEAALRAQAGLPKDLMDELLGSLVSAGMVTVRQLGEKRWYVTN